MGILVDRRVDGMAGHTKKASVESGEEIEERGYHSSPCKATHGGRLSCRIRRGGAPLRLTEPFPGVSMILAQL